VVLSHYRLTIVPDLESARFSGSVVIDVDVVEPVDRIELNAAELEIDAVAVVGSGATLTPDHEAEDQRLVLTLDEPLPAGPHGLHIEFRGILNDQLRGFYRSRYRDAEGEERTIGVTQFEATDARRAFPCWDEPDIKATFSLTLVVEPDLFVVSNSSIVEDVIREDGRRQVRFAETMKMSTYLLAWIVGELEATEAVDVDGVPLRIVHEPGKGELTGFSLAAGAFALRYLRDYYAIPYPGDKLDLVAVPDFAWGAMENLGCVTFRENLLLVDPRRATQREMQRIVDVIAHEIAHMWFGDLVTMKWWNGIWLNEAFATFMELKTTDAYRPEWGRWIDFGTEAASAREIDALAATRPIDFPVATPDEANEMFDALTYDKGASVLRMLEQYVGDEAFRRGVGDYLRAHQYGNAEAVDLWEALEKASGEPVGSIMDTWILQGGLPVVRVAKIEGGYRLTQRQFELLDGGAGGRWIVPVLWRPVGSADSHRLLLEEQAVVTSDEPIIVNAGGHGFYLVDYDDACRAATSEAYDRLAPLERFMLVDDTWGLVLSGDVGLEVFLDLLENLGDERQPAIWDVVESAMTEIDRIVPDAARHAFKARADAVFTPLLVDLGWAPVDGDDDLVRKLRATALRAAGRLADHDEAIDRSRTIVSSILDGGGAHDPDLAAAAVGVVAWHGTDDDFDRFVERFENAATPQDKVRFLYSLAAFPHERQADEVFRMMLAGRIRSQDAPGLIATMLTNRRVNAAVWAKLKRRWDEVHEIVPEAIAKNLHRGLRALTHPESADDVRQWFAQHETSHPKSLAQRLELLSVYEGFRGREQGGIAEKL
jgi:puromycin-sensitive aminopeptidase